MSEGKKSVYKPKPVSGFPEWLPEVRIVEQQWLDHIRRVFESYGFCSVETPSVEELEVLHAKGEVDKEIYVLERLHREEGDKEARLALHFDQTVPLARYVAQNFNELVFPFKRYQMQRVWRGERPQKGRFREFTQCDIDVINIDALPLHFDAEMPAIIWEAMNGLPGMENEKIQIRINNRKLITGIVAKSSPAQANVLDVIRLIDKVHKIGFEQLAKDLVNQYGFEQRHIDVLLKVLKLPKMTPDVFPEFRDFILSIGADMPQINEGLLELAQVMINLSHLPKNSVVADLSIVRGLDYYTGTVYETVFVDDPSYGSICSGGRYEDLATQYINKKLPGVGISIGFSRLFAYLLEKGALPVGQKSPAHVLMVLPNEERRADAAAAAQKLRARGYNVELYHAAKKIPDQLKYASRKGIPFVWFPPFEDGKPHEVKNMTTGEQKAADPATWEKNNGN